MDLGEIGRGAPAVGYSSTQNLPGQAGSRTKVGISHENDPKGRPSLPGGGCQVGSYCHTAQRIAGSPWGGRQGQGQPRLGLSPNPSPAAQPQTLLSPSQAHGGPGRHSPSPRREPPLGACNTQDNTRVDT